jgi:hypothetical protein
MVWHGSGMGGSVAVDGWQFGMAVAEVGGSGSQWQGGSVSAEVAVPQCQWQWQYQWQ